MYRNLRIDNFGQMFNFFIFFKSLVQSFKKMGLSFDKIGYYTNKIDI